MGPKPAISARVSALVLYLFCLGAPAGARPCQLAINSKLKLLQHGLVEADINGEPVRLILDTGASTTVLTEIAAKRLRLRVDPDTSQTFRGITHDPWLLSGIGGARLGDEVLANTFELGGLIGHRFHFLTAPIPLGEADGLLSTDFISDYDVDLDFAGKEIRLFRAIGDCARPKVLLQPPVYATPLLDQPGDKRPRVQVFIGDRRLVALIDTGASRSAIYRNVAASVGVAPDGLASERHAKVRGIGPNEVLAPTHVFPAVTVGDLTFRNMPVQILDQRSDDDVEMILGTDFQQKTHLWISNSAQLLIMQYPAQASPD